MAAVTEGTQQRQKGGRHRRVRWPGMKAMAGRLSWGLGDQAVSSLTNFAVGLYVARSLGATAFGVFSLAWVTYGVILNISRGLATDPLMVRYSAVGVDAWRHATARAVGTALAVGCAAGVLSVVAGLAIGGKLGLAFVGLGIVLPGLLLQDAWRFGFFAAGKGQKAFINDLVWGLALAPALILAAKHGSVLGFVLAWGVSGAVAAGYGCFQTGILPNLSGVTSWLRSQRELGSRYLIENVSSSGASQLRAYGLGAIAGLAAVGTVRGAELLMGPFQAVLMGLSLVTVAEAARVLRRAPRKLPAFCLILGTGQAAAAMLWGLILLFLLPETVGVHMLGSIWPDAHKLILPATLSVMGASFSTGAASGLRALGLARLSLRSQVIASVFYATGGLAGAAVDGAVGSAWGVASATLIGSAVWWTQLRVGMRVHNAERTQEMRIP
jgi:O-antigen/teichoic acid export membrane protein